MKSRMIAVSCAVVAMAIAGCADASSPVAGNPGNNTGGIGSSRQIDKSLDKLNPEMRAWVSEEGGYELSMLVGAGGMSDSPELEAIRGIRAVEFQIYSPERQRIDFRSTDDVISSGVARDDGLTSLTVTANVEWTPPTPVTAGTFAVMTIHTDDGVVERSGQIPAQQ